MDVDAPPVFPGAECHESPKWNGVGGRCGGVSALQEIALVYCGEDQPASEEDQAMPDESEDSFHCQEHVKLLNPNEAIQDVLDIVGLKPFFEIFADLETAVASFQLVSQP